MSEDNNTKQTNSLNKIITYYPSQEDKVYRVEMIPDGPANFKEDDKELQYGDRKLYLGLDIEVYEPGVIYPNKDNLYVSGSIRWDWCSNFHFDGCVHFCGIENMKMQLGLFSYLYEEAKKYVQFD